MPDRENNYGSNSLDDDALDRLIKETGHKEKPFKRPSDEALAAYLDGSATKEQKLEVREAIIRSHLFRNEIIELSNDVSALETKEVQARFDKVRVPEVPGYGPFRDIEKPAGIPRTPGPGFLDRIADLLSLRGIPRYAAAAINLAVLVICIIALYQWLSPVQTELSSPLTLPVLRTPRSLPNLTELPAVKREGSGEVILHLAISVLGDTALPLAVRIVDESEEPIWMRRVTVQEIRSGTIRIRIEPQTIDPGTYRIIVEDAAERPIRHSAFRIE